MYFEELERKEHLKRDNTMEYLQEQATHCYRNSQLGENDLRLTKVRSIMVQLIEDLCKWLREGVHQEDYDIIKSSIMDAITGIRMIDIHLAKKQNESGKKRNMEGDQCVAN